MNGSLRRPRLYRTLRPCGSVPVGRRHIPSSCSAAHASRTFMGSALLRLYFAPARQPLRGQGFLAFSCSFASMETRICFSSPRFITRFTICWIASSVSPRLPISMPMLSPESSITMVRQFAPLNPGLGPHPIKQLLQNPALKQRPPQS